MRLERATVYERRTDQGILPAVRPGSTHRNSTAIDFGAAPPREEPKRAGEAGAFQRLPRGWCHESGIATPTRSRHLRRTCHPTPGPAGVTQRASQARHHDEEVLRVRHTAESGACALQRPARRTHHCDQELADVCGVGYVIPMGTASARSEHGRAVHVRGTERGEIGDSSPDVMQGEAALSWKR